MSKNMNKIQKIKPYVIQVMVMNLSEADSLNYLLKQGFKISARYLYKLKKQIKESRFDRLSLIAKTGFVDQHLERIDQLEFVNQEYWKLYRQENDNFKKAQILEKIAELQTYVSTYYDASQYIMSKQIQQDNKQLGLGEQKQHQDVSK